MAFVIPDPRWETPALLTPRRHPLGPLKIDWSHPLTRNLQHAIVFNERLPQDLVTGKFLTPVNGPLLMGDGHFLETSVDSYYTLANVRLPRQLTMASRVWAPDNAGTSFKYIVGHGFPGDAETVNWFINNSSTATSPNKILVRSGAVSRTSTPAYWPTYNGSHIAFTQDANSSSSVRMFADGQVMESTGVSSTWYGVDSTRTLYIGSRNDGETTRMLDGKIWYLYIWTDLYIGTDISLPLAINNNPYQFLIPA